MKIEIRYPYGRGIKMTFAMFLQYNHINTNFTSKKVYRAEHAEYTDTRSIFLSS